MNAALQQLIEIVRHRSISQPEFRQKTGLSKSYVCEVFCAAELLGIITPSDETWRDRSRKLAGPAARRYRARVGANG